MKVQYDLEGAVLRQNPTTKSVSKLALYTVLLIVIVVGWVVYQQGETPFRSNESTCRRGKTVEEPTGIETTTGTVKPIERTQNLSSSEDVGDLIGTLFSPFKEAESAVVEVKVDNDGFLIKFGEDVDSLMELARDSEVSTIMAMALQELFLMGQEGKTGKKVDVRGVANKEEESFEVTTAKKTEEIWSWSAGNLLEFKFRFEDDHWELEAAAEYRSEEEKDSNESSEVSAGGR